MAQWDAYLNSDREVVGSSPPGLPTFFRGD